MITKKHKLWLLILCWLTLHLFVPQAFGITYEYSGPNFTTLEGPIYKIGDHISAQLTLANPLEPNFEGHLDLTTLPGFYLTMTDGHATVTGNDSNIISLLCRLDSTDSRGLPSQWDLLIGIHNASQNLILRTFIIHGATHSGVEFYQKFDMSQVINLSGGIQNGFSSIFVPGPDSTGWTISPVPEANSLIALVSGLFALTGLMKSRRHSPIHINAEK